MKPVIVATGLSNNTSTLARFGDDGDGKKGEKQRRSSKSQAEKLIGLADDNVLVYFHDPEQVAFVQVKVDDHKEVLKLRSSAARSYLQHLYYRTYKTSIGSQALQDAIGTLEGKARFEGSMLPVYVRLAGHEGKIYLDLADAKKRVVEVTPSGWRVLRDSPVKFWQPKGLMELPFPVAGGSVKQLTPFVNLSADHFVLFLAFLVACLCPGIPYPLLIMLSEQGTGKSTLARMVKCLVDPSTAPLRSQPREARDLMISAKNSWLLAFDNLSGIPEWLSDALCRLSTGGGFSTRTLYENDEETILDATRPVILTGIDDPATRGDLLDRAVTIEPQRIAVNERKTEQELWQDFEAVTSSIFGALLTAVASGLRNREGVTLTALPRMADFAVWANACEGALELPAGSFMTAYLENRSKANAAALEDSVLTEPLLSVAANGEVRVTATELLVLLGEKVSDELRRNKKWPKSPSSLSSGLRRLAPNLITVGIDVRFERETTGAKRRLVVIRKGAKNADTSDTAEHPEEKARPGHQNSGAASSGGTNDGGDVGPPLEAPNTHADTRESVSGTEELKNGVGGDDGDGVLQDNSEWLRL